ncbi:hypothetical protein BGZ63DRAFT_415562 [Mariannaea sp. PMI_226]|nr:hypothetical protein BGZ63DRAFT_415562 [Mariannaea sp. PMI_226]
MPGFPVTDGVETLLPPPKGYVVNFDNPRQQKDLDHYLVFAIGGTLSLMALGQRFYTKLFLSKGLQLDDGFMFLAWICAIVTQAMLTYSIAQGGMCAHAWEMPLTRFEQYSVITYITAPVYQLCNSFTKLSLLYIYLQLSPQKWFRIAVWTIIGLVAAYTTIIVLLMLFHCSPVRKAFDFTILTGSCMDAGALYIATAVSNIITDVILFVLPIPMVYNLRMSNVQKAGAIIVFGIGSMTVATSIVRLAYLPPVLKSTDPSWDAAPADVWTFVEANLMIICGSMPTLRKFFKHIMPKLMGTSSNRSYPSNYDMQRSATAQRKQRSKYEHFPDENMNEMEVFSSRNDRTGERGGDRTTDGNSLVEADNHSEKAILQTKTFTVQYN